MSAQNHNICNSMLYFSCTLAQQCYLGSIKFFIFVHNHLIVIWDDHSCFPLIIIIVFIHFYRNSWVKPNKTDIFCCLTKMQTGTLSADSLLQHERSFYCHPLFILFILRHLTCIRATPLWQTFVDINMDYFKE